MNLSKAKSQVFAAAFLAALAVPMSGSYAGPFSPMAGIWTGSGILTVSGARERIRCRAIYFVSAGGESLSQNLRCASDSYYVDVNGDLVERGGKLSGSWRETTSGITGTLSGVVRGPIIRGIISALGFNAPLSLLTRGRSQHVLISLGAPKIAEVWVTFHRV